MSGQTEKRCSKCGTVKPIEAFSRQRRPNGKEGRRSHCKECVKLSEVKRVITPEQRARYNARDKEYRKFQRKFNPEYNKRRAEYNKKFRENNPEKYRETLLRHNKRNSIEKYGLKLEEYENMYNAQNGLCAICNGPQIPGKRLAIDHDHTSGVVRGLLCYKCNIGVGIFQEDISFLEGAIAYLRRFKT